MIIVDNVVKNFGSFQALDHVSFEIGKGDIVGFLGKNGAGKTTLMRILTSFLAPSSGKVIIDGSDMAKNSLTIRQQIGYLPETPPLYNSMAVESYLKFAAQIKGVRAKKQRIQLAKVIEECNLAQVKHKTIATLSKGYKQRVGIAQAIIHEPKVLILDEPTSGLDPIQVQQVLALIKNQREQRTVILSTHNLTEIEQIAHRVLIIKSGKIIIDQSLKGLLKAKNDQHTLFQAEPHLQPASLEQIFINLHQLNSSQETTPDNTTGDKWV
ncbi:ABC transporter ATP-binding protein [Colwellia piezophila]|uniref:ABC transporter ATP-binding protein n=1 Tax=Colwellia piezophila TaxID=211668 RepID=UPI00037C8F9B|nr:ABC transporter ATP-binding protein [Colwellia piezophila]